MKIKCDYFNSDFHAYNSIIDGLLLINYNISHLYCNLKTNNTFLIYCPCFWELLFLSQKTGVMCKNTHYTSFLTLSCQSELCATRHSMSNILNTYIESEFVNFCWRLIKGSI